MVEILIVIPVYNHAPTLREVVEGALKAHGRVLVVDDGSTDGGADVLRGLPVPVIRHARNRGKGAAILTAADEAGAQGVTHMVTLDADGQHDPAEIERFLRLISAHPRALLVGKRDLDGAGAPATRRFGRAFSNFWFRVQTGRRVGDSQSGFRAYPVELLMHLPLRERGFAFEIEVLVRAAWAGVEVRDVDVTEDDLGYGEWAVDDGSGEVRVDDMGDYSYSPSIGDAFSSIVGVCWYSYDNWKLQPRDDDDLTD